MRQTQINGETYVNARDVCAWLEKDCGKAESEGHREIAEAFRHMAKALGDWATHPDRRKGVPDVVMKVFGG